MSPPTSQRISTSPSRVAIGCAVRTKRCGNPGALLLSTIAFRIPGPHHSFSLEKPTSRLLTDVSAVVCPRSIRPIDLLPNRIG